MFQIAVTFSLGEGEENSMKGGVNSFGGKHGDKGAKAMEMKCCKDVPGKVHEVHAEGNVGVLKGSLE